MNLAILAAMPDELAPFLAVSKGLTEISDHHAFRPARNSDSSERKLPNSGARFYRAEISGKPVLLVATGVGLVNAATAATLAVTNGVDFLISTGSAGGVGKGVHVGDVVVATETCYSTADATAFTDYALGQIPQMPARFKSDNSAVLAAQNIQLPKGKIHTGLTLSSDAFIWEKNYADYVAKFPDAMATDMETAAIGQVAYQFGVPWLSVRGISDLCGPQGADDFYTHLDGAANIAADVVVQLVGQLA